MIDTMMLGQLTAQTMDAVTEAFSEPYELRTVAIIVEVDSDKGGHLIVKSTEDRPWVLQAFLNEALDAVESLRGSAVGFTDDDD